MRNEMNKKTPKTREPPWTGQYAKRKAQVERRPLLETYPAKPQSKTPHRNLFHDSGGGEQ